MSKFGRFKGQVEVRIANADGLRNHRVSLGLPDTFGATRSDSTSVAGALLSERGTSRLSYLEEQTRGPSGEAAYVLLDPLRLEEGASFNGPSLLILRDEVLSRSLGPAIRYGLGDENLVAKPFEEEVVGDLLTSWEEVDVYIPGIAIRAKEQTRVGAPGNSYLVHKRGVRFDPTFRGPRETLATTLLLGEEIDSTVFANPAGTDWFTVLRHFSGGLLERVSLVSSDGQVLRSLVVEDLPSPESVREGLTYRRRHIPYMVIPQEDLAARVIPTSGIKGQAKESGDSAPVYLDLLGDFSELTGVAITERDYPCIPVGGYGRYTCFIRASLSGNSRSLRFWFWDREANDWVNGNTVWSGTTPLVLGGDKPMVTNTYWYPAVCSSERAMFYPLVVAESDDGSLISRPDLVQAAGGLPRNGCGSPNKLILLKKKNWTCESVVNLAGATAFTLTYHV